jgi:chromosome segregation ATPase
VEQLNTSQADYYALEAAHSRIRILLDEARHNAEQASAETLRLSLTIDRLAPFENNVAELSRRLRELESNIVNLESERQALQEQTIQRSREAVAAQTDLASLRTDYVDAQTELVK